MTETYTTEYFTTRETWRDWRIEAQQLIQLAGVKSGVRVLEVGCGSGGLLRLLVQAGAAAVGIDTSELGLQLAHERNDCRNLARIDESGRLPFRDASFDAIVAQHLFEHVGDAQSTLTEWRRVLRPGGRIAIATPNVRYPDPSHFADDDHDHVFSPTELSDAVKQAGFNVESCYTLFPYLTRLRALRGMGVVGHALFRRLPYFGSRGRTIMLGARKVQA